MSRMVKMVIDCLDKVRYIDGENFNWLVGDNGR